MSCLRCRPRVGSATHACPQNDHCGYTRQHKSRNHDRLAIHGFRRIGRSLMKAALDGDLLVPVSISDIKDNETLPALFEGRLQLRTLVRAGRDKARV
jgi:hypothetical protein